MSTSQTFVIVGASLAGAKAAEELRSEGFEGRVVLLGSEDERPYERPPLSKEYLLGKAEREKAFVHEAGFYAEHEIELESSTTVASIDPGEGRVTLEGGREIAFDRLLLSTGAAPRTISIDGAELDGVHYLRTLADCDALRARLEDGGHVVVVGAGWIGSEFAAAARLRGAEVTVIEPQSLPNERTFGREIGEFYRDVHLAHGVELVLGDSVEAILGSGAASGVRTKAGRQFDCDFVVVGVGAVPRVELASAVGLGVDNGIVVDERLATSAENIFAAGDVARAWHPFFGEPVRVEHWANALTQGPAAARSMLGLPTSYDRIPYFYSDQYDVGMEYSGWAPQWDEVVFRGERESGEFIAFWLKDRRVIAGMNVNVWDVNDTVQALIRSRAELDAATLADPDTPLESLVPKGSEER